MADSSTTNFSFVLPEVTGSDNTWGTKLNANWTALDAELILMPKLDGSRNFTAKQTFADAGIGIEDFTIRVSSEKLQILHSGDVIWQIEDDGTMTANTVVEDDAL